MKYEIKGNELPVVICYLEDGETMITERGSMSWMSPNMKMETTSNGGIGKALGRMFAGEAIFQNRYTATGGNGMIAFASSFPGQIRPWEIGPGNEVIVQKSGFLAAEESVELFSSRKSWEQVYSAGRDLSCRDSPVRERHSSNLTVMWWNIICSRDSRS